MFWGAKAVQDVSHRHFAHRGESQACEEKWGRPGLRGAGDKDSQFRNAERIRRDPEYLIPSEGVRVRAPGREEITTQMLAFSCQMLPQPLLRGREEQENS